MSYPQWHEDVTGGVALLQCRGVEWKLIRAAFIRARGTRIQEDIAKAGGLYQSAVSKLENNDQLGPAVGVFVKAIQGLGLKPSEFFAEIERLQNRAFTGATKHDKTGPTSSAGVEPLSGGSHHGSSSTGIPAQHQPTIEALQFLLDMAAVKPVAPADAATGTLESEPRSVPSPDARPSRKGVHAPRVGGKLSHQGRVLKGGTE